MMIKAPALTNAVTMACQNPGTLIIPSYFERINLRVGDLAQVVAAGEPIWVEVETVDCAGAKEARYVGRVSFGLHRDVTPQQPILLNSAEHHIYYDDRIEFTPENIYDTDNPQ